MIAEMNLQSTLKRRLQFSVTPQIQCELLRRLFWERRGLHATKFSELTSVLSEQKLLVRVMECNCFPHFLIGILKENLVG